MPRFVVLDSWRGICACMVVLMHFSSSGILTNLPFVKNGYLFVDFFFVLSGFVIQGNYHARMDDQSSLWSFIIARFGRLYPLHFTMLMCLIAMQCLQLMPGLEGLASSPPFAGEAQGFLAILTNLGLVHGLGIHGVVTWNSPSWSISTEFWAYVYFALITLLKKGEHVTRAALTICLAGPLLLAILSPYNMNTTFDYGIIRCLFGFSAGMLTFKFYQAFTADWQLERDQASRLEAYVVVTILLFVSLVGESLLSLLAPLVFSFAILVFSKEKGIISSWLKTPFLVLVGTLSYSIYMTHIFIQKFWIIGGLLLGRVINYKLIQDVPRGGREDMERSFGQTIIEGDLAATGMLSSVIFVSYFTYRWIEDPWRRKFRALASHLFRDKSRNYGSTS